MKWPADTRESQKTHALKHVRTTLTEHTFSLCRHKRTAIQAGGNMGLWPMKMAQHFHWVITFEPEPITRECLEHNCRNFSNILVRHEALGAASRTVGIERLSLGSHQIREQGSGVDMITVDSLGFTDVDLIQLDVEGYEFNIIQGAKRTIEMCRPVIQVEMRGLGYSDSDWQLTALLNSMGYGREFQINADHIFSHLGSAQRVEG